MRRIWWGRVFSSAGSNRCQCGGSEDLARDVSAPPQSESVSIEAMIATRFLDRRASFRLFGETKDSIVRVSRRHIHLLLENGLYLDQAGSETWGQVKSLTKSTNCLEC